MKTACESAKGIVFVASDSAPLIAGSALGRQQRLQELRFGALIVEPRRPVDAVEDRHLPVVDRRARRRDLARPLAA